jgi:hypothetical protein
LHEFLFGGAAVSEDRNVFSKKNELIRIESLAAIDDKLAAPLRTFFRRIGLPHVYDEFVVPVLADGAAVGIVAVKDRAWPPWGVGAQTIHALTIASPVTSDSAGLSNIFVLDEDAGNIALVAAVYSELLNSLDRRGVKDISYIVLEGSIFAGRVLAGLGFSPTEELFLSHGSRYTVHSSALSVHREAISLHETASPDLLGGNLGDSAFGSVVGLHAATSIGSLAFYSERAASPEILPNTGGFQRASRPGGVPIRNRPEEDQA